MLSGRTLGTRSRQVAKEDTGKAGVPKASRGADRSTGVWYPRWYWPSFTVPGLIWLAVFFVLPFYVVLSVAFGTVTEFFRNPLPVYEPWWWSAKTFTAT